MLHTISHAEYAKQMYPELLLSSSCTLASPVSELGRWFRTPEKTSVIWFECTMGWQSKKLYRSSRELMESEREKWCLLRYQCHCQKTKQASWHRIIYNIIWLCTMMSCEQSMMMQKHGNFQPELKYISYVIFAVVGDCIHSDEPTYVGLKRTNFSWDVHNH